MWLSEDENTQNIKSLQTHLSWCFCPQLFWYQNHVILFVASMCNKTICILFKLNWHASLLISILQSYLALFDTSSTNRFADWYGLDNLTLLMLRLLSSNAQKSKKKMKIILTLSSWYSLESSCWALSDEYPFAMVSIICKLFVIVHVDQISHQQQKGLKMQLK